LLVGDNYQFQHSESAVVVTEEYEDQREQDPLDVKLEVFSGKNIFKDVITFTKPKYSNEKIYISFILGKLPTSGHEEYQVSESQAQNSQHWRGPDSHRQISRTRSFASDKLRVMSKQLVNGRRQNCWNSKNVYVCPNCHKAFSKAAQLRRHELIHLQIKPFKCSRCPKTFSRKDHLTLHTKTHLRIDALRTV